MNHNRVLIIDDDPRICRIIKRVADQLDLASHIQDKPELFELSYVDFLPNVIFMDLQMPKIDGIELLRVLAKKQSKVAIILISGMDRSVLETTIDLGNALGLNMVGILSKPLDIDQISEVLHKHYEPAKTHNIKCLDISEDEILQGIQQKQFLVYYQPQINLESGKIVGVEALVRWMHPEHGLLFPDSFIFLAEKHKDLIAPLTYLVLETALIDDEIRRQQGNELTLSVNLSAKLLNDLSLPDKIDKLLQKYHFENNRLILEITESGAMESPSLTMDILTRLRLKNIKLSIDDFGTGFSSLVQLYRMPFNEIKVDMSFVRKAMKDKEAAAIVKMTIDLGHHLNLEVVAEGVEDLECYNWLKSLGCDIGQGYHMSRPIDSPQLLEWINKYNVNLLSDEPLLEHLE